MVILPALEGAVANKVKAAVPAEVDAPSALLRVTVQVSSAPALEGRLPQLTLLTPVPAVTDLATTPDGNCSFTVADRPLAVPPLLPRPKV